MSLSTPPAPVDRFSKSRIEALSDGLFAIVLTLLILELKVPDLGQTHGDSARYLAVELLRLAPKFLSWIISYLVLAVVWQNHHRLFEMFQHITKRLYWANALLLMSVSFIPFPTALWGEYPSNALAVCIYGVMMVVVTLGFLNIRLCVHQVPTLLKPEYDLGEFRSATRNVLLFGCGAYLAGATIAWVSTLAAALIYLAISVHFFLTAKGR